MDEQVIQAVEPLRSAFQTDDMDPRIGRIDPAGIVDVEIYFGPNACEECFVGEDVVTGMLKHVLLPVMRNLRQINRVLHGR